MASTIPESIDLDIKVTMVPLYAVTEEEDDFNDPRALPVVIIERAAEKLVEYILREQKSDEFSYVTALTNMVSTMVAEAAEARVMEVVNRVFENGRMQVSKNGYSSGETQSFEEFIVDAVREMATPKKPQYRDSRGNEIYELIATYAKTTIETNVKMMLNEQKNTIMTQLTATAAAAFLKGMGIEPQPGMNVVRLDKGD